MILYKLATIGTSARGGANQAVEATVRGVAKTNAHFPFTISNEVVAAKIGQALGLPIPAGVLAEHAGQNFYLSLDVSASGNQLPPIIPPDFLAQHARLAAGSVVFDILIANNDRHASNISLDPDFVPPRPSLFDHGHSLLGSGHPSGADRLNQVRDLLGCDGGAPLGGSRQVFLDLLTSDADLFAWVERVKQLPNYVIDDCCDSIVKLGLNIDGGLAVELASWLKQRRDTIETLIVRHSAEFRGIAQWNLLGGQAP